MAEQLTSDVVTSILRHRLGRYVTNKRIQLIGHRVTMCLSCLWWDSRGGSRIPRRRGRQPSRRWAPTYKFARFVEKMHEIKKIFVRGGGRAQGAPPPLDPPLDRNVLKFFTSDFLKSYYRLILLTHLESVYSLIWGARDIWGQDLGTFMISRPI